MLDNEPVSELLGWGRRIDGGSSHGKKFAVYRYMGNSYAPTHPSGCDRDGDYYTTSGQLVGKLDVAFEWIDAPEPYIQSKTLLDILLESGKITEEDIQAARTAAKLLNRTNP